MFSQVKAVNDPRFNTKNKTRHNYLIEMQERKAHMQNLKNIINGKKKKNPASPVKHDWYSNIADYNSMRVNPNKGPITQGNSYNFQVQPNVRSSNQEQLSTDYMAISGFDKNSQPISDNTHVLQTADQNASSNFYQTPFLNSASDIKQSSNGVNDSQVKVQSEQAFSSDISPIAQDQSQIQKEKDQPKQKSKPANEVDNILKNSASDIQGEDQQTANDAMINDSSEQIINVDQMNQPYNMFNENPNAQGQFFKDPVTSTNNQIPMNIDMNYMANQNEGIQMQFQEPKKNKKQKYTLTRTEKIRHNQIEHANEALLRRMVGIVNRKNKYLNQSSNQKRVKKVANNFQQSSQQPMTSSSMMPLTVSTQHIEDFQLGRSRSAVTSTIKRTTSKINQFRKTQVKKQKNINNQNKTLLYRLMNTPSSFPKKQWEKHAQKYFWTKERICTTDNNQVMMDQMKIKYEQRVQNMQLREIQIDPSMRNKVQQDRFRENSSAGFTQSQNQVGYYKESLDFMNTQQMYNDDKYFTQYSNGLYRRQQNENTPGQSPVIKTESYIAESRPQLSSQRLDQNLIQGSMVQNRNRPKQQSASNRIFSLDNIDTRLKNSAFTIDTSDEQLVEGAYNDASSQAYDTCMPLTNFQAKQLALIQPNKNVISMSNVIKAMKSTNLNKIKTTQNQATNKSKSQAVTLNKNESIKNGAHSTNTKQSTQYQNYNFSAASKSVAQANLLSRQNQGSEGSLPVTVQMNEQFMSGALPIQVNQNAYEDLNQKSNRPKTAANPTEVAQNRPQIDLIKEQDAASEGQK